MAPSVFLGVNFPTLTAQKIVVFSGTVFGVNSKQIAKTSR
jgi:hypothetical protein